ncbi:MAG TPA: TetR family transcriptional regulator [Cryptosporangiaceae bacterium]|nr:TetR family transcriptional regulator [Cryptosporangiaceae bacterium]
MARTGRRAGGSGTREAILDAARTAFADGGYDGATIRGIAGVAGVDAALVHHYFGTKEKLFVVAMRLPIDPSVMIPALLAPGLDGLGERIVRLFLSIWDSPEAVSPFLGLIRGAMTHERSAAMLREFIGSAVIGRLTAALEVDRARLRGTFVGSTVLGLAIARYVIRIEPLASASTDEVVAAVGPTIQRYLTEPLA